MVGAASQVTSAARVKKNFARNRTKVADGAKWSDAASWTEVFQYWRREGRGRLIIRSFLRSGPDLDRSLARSSTSLYTPRVGEVQVFNRFRDSVKWRSRSRHALFACIILTAAESRNPVNNLLCRRSGTWRDTLNRNTHTIDHSRDHRIVSKWRLICRNFRVCS